jgi:hypothetical protein
MLTVPTPQLAYEPLAPGVAALEKPLTVTVGPLAQNGSPVGAADLAASELLTFRRVSSGAPVDLWDDASKAWVADPGAQYPAGAAARLAFDETQPAPWRGLLVAAGTKDAAGNPQFSRAVAGYPAYWFRARFATKSGAAALSDATPTVGFLSVADMSLIALGPPQGQRPDNATEMHVELRDHAPSADTIGGLVITRAWPGAEVSIANAAGAAVVLKPDGSIELRTAPGRAVAVYADIEVGRVTYIPAAGGAPQALA